MRAIVRGGGSIGARHAEVLAGLGAEVLLWPVRPRPAEAPVPPGVSRHLDDAAAADALPGADLVVVATDTGRHVTDVLQALDAGAVRVLAEKPLAPSAAETRALLTHPRADAVAVAAPLRGHTAFAQVRETVQTLEGPLTAHVACQSWLPDWRPGRDYRESYSARADEGGVLRDLVHELDYAQALLGEPELLWARLDHDGPLEMAAEQAATLAWATDRAVVTARLDYTSRPGRRVLTIDGPGGAVEWDVLARTVRVRTGSDGVFVTEHPDDADRNLVMGRQARAFLEGRGSHEDPAAPPTLAEAVATVELCDAARAASGTDPGRHTPQHPHRSESR